MILEWHQNDDIVAEWARNDWMILELLEWVRDNRMTTEWREQGQRILKCTSNDTGMTSGWW